MVGIALRAEFKVNKAESTTETVRRVHAAFLKAGLTDVRACFTMVDGPSQRTSSVARVIKRFPDMKRFDYSASPWPSAALERQISNDYLSPVRGEAVDLATLLDILSGIPKAYPFFTATVRLTHPLFGAEPDCNRPRNLCPGVTIIDRWGRSKRELLLETVIDLDANVESESLPEPAGPVAAVLGACGRPSNMQQRLLPGQMTEVSQKVAAITKDLEAHLVELVQRARLPHDFTEEHDHPPKEAAGPRKPALVSAFRPLGYECRGEGMMILVCRRRTSTNLAVKLHLDFGTWGSLVHPTYSVQGLGFSVAIRLPVSPRSVGSNTHWLVDGERWQQVVDNLAALVAELDRSFVPAIEAVAGHTPAWYRPETAG